MDITNIKFIDNSATKNSDGRYTSITVTVDDVLKSWRDSVFSYEWMDGEGKIKAFEELPEHEKPKRTRVEDIITQGLPLEKPLLGIGLKDNVEIGVGRAEFLTLASHGMKTIPVHIPKSNESDFKAFLADVD